MNKPITIAREEFLNGLINLVNNAGLPAFIMREAMGNVYTELQRLEKEQLERDKIAWEHTMAEEKGEENDNG